MVMKKGTKVVTFFKEEDLSEMRDAGLTDGMKGVIISDPIPAHKGSSFRVRCENGIEIKLHESHLQLTSADG